MASTAEFFATRARGMMIVFVTILTLLASAAFAQSPVSDDTYVSSAAPTTNNGNSPSLVVQKSSNGTTLIKLDLTQLQAAGVQGNAVSKAYLKLYTSAVTGQGTFDVYQVTSPWVEGTVTYNTMPSMTLVAAGGGSCPGVQCVNTTSKYVQVDITSLVQGWLNAPSTNLGLALKPNGTTISVTFESKESTTTSHAPEVDVVLNTTLSQIPGSISESQVTNLPTDIGNLNINVASKIPLSFMGATNGVATLDGTTHVPVSQLPGTLVYNNQANTYGAGNKQTFTSNGTAGLNLAGTALDPTTLAVGDLWFNSSIAPIGHLKFKAGTGPAETLAYLSDISGTLSAANSYTDSKVATEASARSAADAAEALARASGDAATLATANTYTDSSVLTEKNRATAAETSKANLVGGNIFIGGSQKLAAAAAAYPSLNVPNSTTAPTTPAIGDLWLLNLDPHLNFRDMNNVTQMLAFTSDVTAANSSTLSSANSYTDSKVTAEATARSTADAAEAVARANGDATTLASANTYTGNAVSAEAVLRAAGDAAAVSSANAYTDGQVATINTSLTGKANLSGGNNFIGNQSITGNASITGNETVNGLLTLPVSAAGNNQPSHLFQLNATDNTGTAQSAQLQALADGSLSFRFGPTAGPIFQKLSIDNAGNIAFAGTQTFPGTVTSAQFASLGTAGTINSAGNPVDWTKLKNVPAGIAGGQVVTSVNTGAGLTGGPITSTGTISIASAGVTNAMLQNSSIGVTAGAGISVAGTSSLGGSFSIVNTGVLSFNTRTGAVTPQANDYSFAQLSGTDSATSHLVYDNQANTYGAGSKQTFKASATLAGLNLAGTSADPSPSLAAGDLWYNNSSGTNHPRFYDGTTTHSLAFADDSGANLTNLNASNLSSGTVPAARLSGTYAITVNGNASTATALAAVPSQCAASTFATGVAANGNANCTQPSAGNLSNGTSGSGAIVLATSPALAGTPTAPTAAAGTNTTQVATTAFVQSAASSAAATISFIKDTSAGALPNKSSAWVGNSLTGDGSGLEANFEFLVGQTPTFTKFYCRLSASQPQVVTFQLFDGSANPVSGASCQIAANATSNTATVSVALTAGGLYAVKATLASGTFGGGGPNAWWALGQ